MLYLVSNDDNYNKIIYILLTVRYKCFPTVSNCKALFYCHRESNYV